MYRSLILPAALLAGTIIGAGVFALPYVFLMAGLVTGLFYLTIFAGVFSLIHLMYADIILKTGGDHRIFGYAKIYLGRTGFWSGALVTFLGGIIALTIYLILSVSFINLIWPALPDIYKLLLFWFAGSLPIFWGVKKLAISEILITGGIIGIILVIFFYGAAQTSWLGQENLFNAPYLFLPFGATLFALGGRVAIPSVVDYFRKSRLPTHSIKSSIILGTFLPALVYLIFILGVWGASKNVSEDAVSGLIGNAPMPILWALGVLGLIALWSTYIVILQYIKSGLEFDFGLPKILAGLMTIFAPLVLYFSGFKNFLNLIGLAGSIFIGLDSILVILIWLRAAKLKPRSEIFRKLSPVVPYILLIVFMLGIILKLSR